MPEQDFPLFPLDLVALPHEAIPLHIFEQRFREMIQHCLEQESEFGIIWLSDEELAPVGCACAVERVLERLEDGRVNLVARGRQPFTLLERQHDLPYPAGAVEWLDDEPEPDDPEAAATAKEAFARLVSEATDSQPDPQELAALDSYGMAAKIDFDKPAKQKLLELRSESARLRAVAELIDEALERLESLGRAQARARSNGKVRFN